MTRLILFFVLAAAPPFVAAQVLINEVCSRNNSVLEDAHGHHPDWIELFNAGSTEVALSGLYLSDRNNDPLKWALPPVVLPPGGFILFFSGEASDHYFSFGISADGEGVFLSDQTGQLLDELIVPPLRVDHSYGRTPDGPRFFDQPTPGQANTTPGWLGYTPAPTFTPPPGIHSAAIQLDIAAAPPATIHYRLGGGVPDPGSPIATGPIAIGNSTVARAIAVEPDHLSSEIVTGSYLIGVHHQLPVISITVDPDSMFHEELGIYVFGPDADTVHPYWGANFWERRYIPAHLEFHENGQLRISQQVDVRIHGGTSARTRPQRPLRMTGRGRYGARHIQYPLFPERPEDQRYKQLVLRNSGGDFCLANFRDGLFHQLALHHHLDIDVLAFKPMVTYINGRYWGFMNLRERIQPENLSLAHDVDRTQILLMDGENESMQGDTLPFFELKEYILGNDMNDPQHFEYVKELLDIRSFIDYFVLEMFAGNVDWPANNIRYWKPSLTEGRWRYLLHDLDATMQAAGYIPMDIDMFHWVLVHRAGFIHSEILRSLLGNHEFRRAFINRFADLMNTAFTPASLEQEVELIVNVIHHEIPHHFARWGNWVQTWHDHAQGIIPQFARERPGHVRGHIVDEFGLQGQVQVSLEVFPPEGGTITVNTITPTLPFEGIYFNGNEVDLSIEVADGFVFDHWEFENEPDVRNNSVHVRRNLASNGRITAVLKQQGDELKAWPNPASTRLMLSFNAAGAGEARVAMHDMNGRQVLQRKEPHHEGTNRMLVDLEDLAAGVFILTVEHEGSRRTTRVVKIANHDQ